MGKGNDGSGWSMPVYPRPAAPKTPLSRPSSKKRKRAKIDKEAHARKAAQKAHGVADATIRNAEREEALSQKPRLIKKGDGEWNPPKGHNPRSSPAGSKK